MVETLAIAAVVTFSVGLGVALAPAIALNRSIRSERPKVSERKKMGNGSFLGTHAGLDPSDHRRLGLSHHSHQASPLRHRFVKHEL